MSRFVRLIRNVFTTCYQYFCKNVKTVNKPTDDLSDGQLKARTKEEYMREQ